MYNLAKVNRTFTKRKQHISVSNNLKMSIIYERWGADLSVDNFIQESLINKSRI